MRSGLGQKPRVATDSLSPDRSLHLAKPQTPRAAEKLRVSACGSGHRALPRPGVTWFSSHSYPAPFLLSGCFNQQVRPLPPRPCCPHAGPHAQPLLGPTHSIYGSPGTDTGGGVAQETVKRKHVLFWKRKFALFLPPRPIPAWIMSALNNYSSIQMGFFACGTKSPRGTRMCARVGSRMLSEFSP